jgi:hypothetical protein
MFEATVLANVSPSNFDALLCESAGYRSGKTLVSFTSPPLMLRRLLVLDSLPW